MQRKKFISKEKEWIENPGEGRRGAKKSKPDDLLEVIGQNVGPVGAHGGGAFDGDDQLFLGHRNSGKSGGAGGSKRREEFESRRRRSQKVGEREFWGPHWFGVRRLFWSRFRNGTSETCFMFNIKSKCLSIKYKRQVLYRGFQIGHLFFFLFFF